MRLLKYLDPFCGAFLSAEVAILNDFVLLCILAGVAERGERREEGAEGGAFSALRMEATADMGSTSITVK